MTEQGKEGRKDLGGRLGRMARLATVAARTTADVLAARAKQKLTGEAELDVGAALKPTAERLVEVLGEMRGAATKLGQFISLVDQETFPEEARKALTKLLHQTPRTLPWAEVREVVTRELGQPPEQAFQRIDETPFAAASMGQVHAATTHDGRDVVVKVQFPGVDQAIENDLKNVAVFARTLSAAASLLDHRGYVDELAAVLRRELDYRQETVQLRAYRAALEPWPDLYVPDVVDELSSQRVLTLEHLRGPTMLQVAQDESVGADARFRIGAQLVRATWGPFLRHRVIHADPHPGNYVVMADGRLGVLDFGATKVFPVPFVMAYWRILQATFRGERPDLYGLLASAGFQMKADRGKVEPWLRELSEIVERPFLTDHYDWGTCRIAVDVKAHAQRNALLMLQVRAPEEGIMFYRSAVGSAGDLRMLKSAGNFRQTLLDVTEVAMRDPLPEIASALRGPA